ncbi:MAG: hypothetical protein A2Y07_04780 [Planctomycetes bacterium GWF2_50_10]|nr:MAG: hypothetical protein A2Y07_04780 [Planctomycetes bacterium GWF2_50_10]
MKMIKKHLIQVAVFVGAALVLFGCSHPIGGGHVLFDGKEARGGCCFEYTATCTGTVYYVDRNSGKTVMYKAVQNGSKIKMDQNSSDILVKAKRLDTSKTDMVLYMVPKGSLPQCSLGGCR